MHALDATSATCDQSHGGLARTCTCDALCRTRHLARVARCFARCGLLEPNEERSIEVMPGMCFTSFISTKISFGTD